MVLALSSIIGAFSDIPLGTKILFLLLIGLIIKSNFGGKNSGGKNGGSGRSGGGGAQTPPPGASMG